MIGYLQGRVLERNNSRAILMLGGGVGYELHLSLGAQKMCAPGTEVALPVYLSVRENSLELFGFGSFAEKDLFELFLLVSGVGPKTALHLLGLGTVEEITAAIGRGDVQYLTKVSGIGKKTAERIVVELREKLKTPAVLGRNEEGTIESGVLGDVIDGLAALGYSALEAREAVKRLEPEGKSSEQLLKEALQKIK